MSAALVTQAQRPLHPAAVKASCNRVHARGRAYERYGRDFTDDELARIEARIEAGGPDIHMVLRDDKHARRARFALEVDGEWMSIVYDYATRSIVSFLPPQSIDRFVSTLRSLADRPPALPATGLTAPTPKLGAAPDPAPPRRPIPSIADLIAETARLGGLVAPAPPPSDDLPPIPWQHSSRASRHAATVHKAIEKLAYDGPIPATLDAMRVRLAEIAAERSALLAQMADAPGANHAAHHQALAARRREKKAINLAIMAAEVAARQA